MRILNDHDTTMRTWLAISALALAGCGKDDGSVGDGDSTAGASSSDGSSTAGVGTLDVTSAPGTDDTGNVDESSGDPTVADAESGSTAAADSEGTGDESGTPAGDCEFSESFDEGGDAWPAAWSIAGGTMVADVVGGRGRLVPVTNNYSLARMYTPTDCSDAEVTFAFEFSEAGSQGIGVYLRQNGGHLQTTDPFGTGYAVFIESFRQPNGIGAWVEIDGVEIQIEGTVPFAFEPGVPHRARLRVTQADDSTTLLQARMWRDGDAEPDGWQVERMDQTPHLQGAGGGLAIDAYSSRTSGIAADLFVDDIVMTAAD